jgi:hypothetical protein
MKIYIKNMVCQGTKVLLIKELEKLDFKCRSFEGNEIYFENDLSLKEINLLDRSLDKYGVEIKLKESNLLQDVEDYYKEKRKLTEQIKVLK